MRLNRASNVPIEKRTLEDWAHQLDALARDVELGSSLEIDLLNLRDEILRALMQDV